MYSPGLTAPSPSAPFALGLVELRGGAVSFIPGLPSCLEPVFGKGPGAPAGALEAAMRQAEARGEPVAVDLPEPAGALLRVAFAERAGETLRCAYTLTAAPADSCALGGIPCNAFYAAAETARDGIVIFDGAFAEEGPSMLYANQGFERITGYSAAEAQGRPVRMLSGPGTEAPVAEALRAQMQAGMPCEGLVTTYRKDGQAIALQWSVAPFHADGMAAGFVGVVRDVTAQQTAEAALARSERRFQTLLGSLEDVVWSSSIDGKTSLYVNGAAERMLGIPAARLSENTAAWREAVHPDDQEAFDRMIARLLAEGTAQETYRVRHADGSVRVVDARTSVIRDARGAPERVGGVVRDVTEAHTMQQRLLRKQLFIEAALDVMPDPFVVISPERVIVRANRRAGDLLGLPPAQLLGAEALGFWRPDDREHMRQAFEAALGGAPFTREAHLMLPDGRLTPLEVRGALLRDDTGAAAGVCCICRDLTERRRTEAALQEGEQRYRALFANNHAPMLLLSPETGGIVDANPAALHFYGYAYEDLVGRPISLLNGLTETEVRAIMARLVTEGGGRVELRHRLAGGAVRDVESYSGPIHIGGRRLLYSIIHDVTDRQRAQEALRLSEALFRGAFETTRVGKVLVTTEGRIMKVNEAACRMLGRAEAELQAEGLAPFLHPEDRAEGTRIFGELFAGRAASLQTEQRFVRRDQQVMWALVTAAPVGGGPKGPECFVCQIVDISDQKTLEQSMATALRKERELSELKTRFVSMASHEMRTPLATIMGSLELVERFGEQWPEEKRRKHLQRARQSVREMTDLLEDVLALGRAEEGRLPFEPEPTYTQTFLADLVRELEAAAPGRRIDLEHAGPRGAVLVDRKLLRLITSNLVANALKYSAPEAPVRIRISAGPDDALALSVRDEGIGIPQADLPYIFDSFYRAANVGAVRGSGLGLALVKRAADLHGGEIRIASEEGRGTEVSVTLRRPAASAPGNPAAAEG